MSFKKLFAGFLIAITIAIVNVSYNSKTVADNQKSIESITNKVYPYINKLNEFDMMITRSKMLITNWVYLPYSHDDKAALKKLHSTAYPKLKETLLSSLTEQRHETDAAILDSIFGEFESLLGIEQEIMDALETMTDYEDPATMFDNEEIIELEVLPRTSAIQLNLQKVISINQEKAQTQKERMLGSLDQLEKVVLGLGLAITLIMILSYLYIRSQITKPVTIMRNKLLGLSEGNLPNVDVKNTSTVIGKMNEALARLANNFKLTANFAEEIGKGNYDADYEALGKGDILGNSLLHMRDSLKDYAHNMEKKVEHRTAELQQKQKELAIKNQELVASEEEIRQNAEEIQAVNDHLSKVMESLESKNNALQASEEEIRQNAEELSAVNEHLNKTNKMLEVAMNELKDTQSQLIQTEKMSSLGQLTAGVAHEINNPINFVFAGANTLKNVIDELCTIVNKYAALDIHGDTEQLLAHLKEIEEIKVEVHFDEMEEDMLGLIDDIILGADRTQKIVQSLKTFSRLDEEDLKKADVVENLEATLTILNSQLDNRIEIVKEYDPNLPMIDCHIGQINQVFMNLINNACQAIKGKGQVTLKTWADRATNQCFIQIKDTGTGMEEEVLDKVFEPFFTTKDVGEGTGLGLSIAHGIIEKHNGTIKVESEVGKGSAFTLMLPIDQS